MLRNYFLTAVRNLMKNRTFFVIKIVSLAVGLIAAIFIYLWVIDEMSFDQFHANAKNIYRVMTNNTLPENRIETYPATSALLKDAIQREIPEVDKVALLSMGTGALLRHEKNTFNETGVY